MCREGEERRKEERTQTITISERSRERIRKSELDNMPKLTRKEERRKKYRNENEVKTDGADPKSHRGPERTYSEAILKS